MKMKKILHTKVHRKNKYKIEKLGSSTAYKSSSNMHINKKKTKLISQKGMGVYKLN